MPGQTSRDYGSTEGEIKGEALPGRIRFVDRFGDVGVGAVLVAGFTWRLWLARATFFNTDEAWHFALANQASAWLAYKASLTISHPPLLVLILHFWRALGTSNLILRLPSVIAGTLFCWIFFRWLDLVSGRAAAWVGLILATFLAPMISTSAEVRQNPLLLFFSIGAIYFFDLALEESSAFAMCASSTCLYFAMLSHYAAFFVAAALGVYSIVRIVTQRPPAAVVASWIAGQISGVALAGFLFKTHLGRLNQLLSQALLPQQYLSASYFHPGSDHLFFFLYRGTFGVFRFVFGQTQIGQLAAIVFMAGVALLFLGKTVPGGSALRKNAVARPARTLTLGILLLLPFILSWAAAAAGLYPYGRTRQCMFLAIFCLAGISICLSTVCRGQVAPATALAIAIVVLCHAFGILQDRDAFPLAEQRYEHMDAAIQLMATNVSARDVILTDKATSYQLLHYLCRQKQPSPEPSWEGYEVFRCGGFVVLSTTPSDGALTAQKVIAKWRWLRGFPIGVRDVWVVQGGWASSLGEQMRELGTFPGMEIHNFGRYLEAIKMPPGRRTDVTAEPPS